MVFPQPIAFSFLKTGQLTDCNLLLALQRVFKHQVVCYRRKMQWRNRIKHTLLYFAPLCNLFLSTASQKPKQNLSLVPLECQLLPAGALRAKTGTGRMLLTVQLRSTEDQGTAHNRPSPHSPSHLKGRDISVRSLKLNSAVLCLYL